MLALLAAPMALGTVLGSPAALSLAALVGAWTAGRRGAGVGAGSLAGVAVALDHRALLVVPFLMSVDASARVRAKAIASALAAYLLLVAPVALLDPASFAARLGEQKAPGAGLGLFNLLAYRGAEASAGAFAFAALAPILLAGFVLWLLKRPWPRLALGGIASLAGILLAPALSPEAVAVPVVLLGLAGMRAGAERGQTEAGSAENGRPLGSS